MKINLEKLETELNERKNEIGLIGTRLDINEIPGKDFNGSMTQDFRTINLSYGSDLDLVPDRQTAKFVKRRKISDPYKKIGIDIFEHEAGHRENPIDTMLGCPYTTELHDAIKSSIDAALEGSNKGHLTDDVTNAFEDIIDNVNCRSNTDFSGMTLFWNNQGLVNADNNKFSGFYEAFVKVNLEFFESKYDYALLKRFFTDKKLINDKVKKFVEYTKKSLSVDSLVNMHSDDRLSQLYLKDLNDREDLWSNLAKKFAVTFSDLLDGKPPSSEAFIPENMFGGKCDYFDKELELPEEKQKIAYHRYIRGKGSASNRDVQEQLFDLYKRISKEIQIQTSHYEESSSMPLIHYGKRFVKEDEQKINFKGVGFDNGGKLNIKTSKNSLYYPVAYKVNLKQFPKLKIALMDRSGSMALNPHNGNEVGDTGFIPWGDNSKWHYALKGYFGIDNFFRNQGVIDYIKNDILGFSGEKLITGKSDEVAKALLVKPDGGTYMDVDRLIKQLNDNCFVLSISDGEFSIDDQQEKLLLEKISNVDYAHIQIGKPNDYYKFLQKNTIPTLLVKGDDDLSNLMVNFVSNYYKAIRKL